MEIAELSGNRQILNPRNDLMPLTSVKAIEKVNFDYDSP